MDTGGLICDFRPGVNRTWLSWIEEPDEDFPEYFTTEDMENENLESNIEGAERVQRWKERLAEMIECEK